MGNAEGPKIAWPLIAPGAALIVLGIINVGQANQPGSAWGDGGIATWPILLAVAIGGVLVLLGVIRTLSRR